MSRNVELIGGPGHGQILKVDVYGLGQYIDFLCKEDEFPSFDPETVICSKFKAIRHRYRIEQQHGYLVGVYCP